MSVCRVLVPWQFEFSIIIRQQKGWRRRICRDINVALIASPISGCRQITRRRRLLDGRETTSDYKEERDASIISSSSVFLNLAAIWKDKVDIFGFISNVNSSKKIIQYQLWDFYKLSLRPHCVESFDHKGNASNREMKRSKPHCLMVHQIPA